MTVKALRAWAGDATATQIQAVIAIERARTDREPRNGVLGLKPPSDTDLNKNHPAVQKYREVARLWPELAVQPDIARTVGEEAEDISFWAAVIRGWIGEGWNKKNTNGMLDYFRRREIPGEKRAAKNGRQAANGCEAPKLDIANLINDLEDKIYGNSN